MKPSKQKVRGPGIEYEEPVFILDKGDSISFEGETYAYDGDERVIYRDPEDFEDTKAKTVRTAMTNTPWFQSQLAPWLEELKADELKGKDIRGKMLIQTDDPFDVNEYARWVVRYVTMWVNHFFYPDNSMMFHPRALYYLLLSANVAWPRRQKDGKMKYSLIPFGRESPKYCWTTLTWAIKIARYAGLISMDQVVDRRVSAGVQPKNLPLKRGKALAKATLDHQLELSANFDLNIDAPVIICVTEKSEIEPELKGLADNYYIAYYVGIGEISLGGCREIYQYIKEHGTIGIVLTFTDFDATGLNIPISIARKLEFFIANDPQAPSIVVYPLVLNTIERDELVEIGIPLLTKTYARSGDQDEELKIFELAALNALAQHRGITLKDLFWQKITTVIPEQFIIDYAKYNAKAFQEEKKMRDGLVYALNDAFRNNPEAKTRAKAFNPKGFETSADLVIDVDQYTDELKKAIEDQPAFAVLNDTVQKLQFTPEDMTTPDPQQLYEQIAQGGKALLDPSWQGNFKATTEILLKAKDDIDKLIIPLTPEEQKRLDEIRQYTLGENELTPTKQKELDDLIKATKGTNKAKFAAEVIEKFAIPDNVTKSFIKSYILEHIEPIEGIYQWSS